MKCIFFPERRFHPSLNRILLYREGKKKKNTTQQPYITFHKNPTHSLPGPEKDLQFTSEAEHFSHQEDHEWFSFRWIGSAQWVPTFSSWTVWCATRQVALLSPPGRAEQKLQNLALSFLSVKLHSSSEISATPLLPCHRSPGKGAFSLFQAPKTVLHQKARVSVRLRSGSDFEHEWAFSIRPEREAEGGGWGRTQGPRVLFKCLPFACLWEILKQQGDGGRRNYGMRTHRPF